MNCTDCQQLLSAHLDRELRPEEQGEVTRHLAGCAACQGEMTALILLKEELRKQPMPAMPSDLIASIETQTVFRMSWWENTRRWWIPTMALATGLAAWTLLHGHKSVTQRSLVPVPVAQAPGQDIGMTIAQSPMVAWQLTADTMTTHDLQ